MTCSAAVARGYETAHVGGRGGRRETRTSLQWTHWASPQEPYSSLSLTIKSCGRQPGTLLARKSKAAPPRAPPAHKESSTSTVSGRAASQAFPPGLRNQPQRPISLPLRAYAPYAHRFPRFVPSTLRSVTRNLSPLQRPFEGRSARNQRKGTENTCEIHQENPRAPNISAKNQGTPPTAAGKNHRAFELTLEKEKRKTNNRKIWPDQQESNLQPPA